MTNTPVFKTNLSNVSNSTSIMLIADTHSDLGQRLHIVRSIQHLSKQGYNTLFLEQPMSAKKHYEDDATFIKKVVKNNGREKAEKMFLSQHNEQQFNRALGGILKWEADAQKINTIFCDEEELHTSSQYYEDVPLITTNEIVRSNLIKAIPALSQIYNIPVSNIKTDIQYAVYGQKTFDKYARKIDGLSEYKEALSQIGSYIRKNIDQTIIHEDNFFKMEKRNHLFAETINNAVNNNPKLKGFGLFGLQHIQPTSQSRLPGLGDILQQKYNIDCIKVGVSSLNTINQIQTYFKKNDVDITLIECEEFLPYANTFFVGTPLEITHALNDNIKDLSEGIYDIKNTSFGLNKEIIIPSHQENELKEAICKKISGTFLK